MAWKRYSGRFDHTADVIWHICLRRIVVGVLCVWPGHLIASDPAMLCESAARKASAATGVPLRVLRAITLAETGRGGRQGLRPWPWTVNMEGKGAWFDDAESARSFARNGFQRGARSFDIGCFQLNYRWHGQNFRSLDEMFQPGPNALYAARFLADLYRETRDWSMAAGAYHSRSPEYAARYRTRFDRIYAGLTADTAVAGAPAPLPEGISKDAAVPRVNPFPLLQSGQGSRGLGSLVPVTGSVGPGLFAQRDG